MSSIPPGFKMRCMCSALMGLGEILEYCGCNYEIKTVIFKRQVFSSARHIHQFCLLDVQCKVVFDLPIQQRAMGWFRPPMSRTVKSCSVLLSQSVKIKRRERQTR